MKNLLHKLFGQENSPSHLHAQHFMSSVVDHCLHEHHRRALIGWIAKRMGQILRAENCDYAKFIYLPFSNAQFIENKEKLEDYLLYLASSLYGWIENGQDVYLYIKQMRLSNQYHTCLLEVYEEIKEDMSRFFPQQEERPIDSNIDEVTWQVYRDVLYAVTQQKFLLIKENEVEPYRQGDIICEAAITERPDIPKARDLAKQSLVENGVPATKVMSHLLLISEAITNILKHAYRGKLTIVKTDSFFHVLTEDSGPGFPLKQLPYTTLMAGYSTKKSLGQGFTLMMKMSEQILLSTIPNKGTTLILVFDRFQDEQESNKS